MFHLCPETMVEGLTSLLPTAPGRRVPLVWGEAKRMENMLVGLHSPQPPQGGDTAPVLALKHLNPCSIPVSPHGAALYLAQGVDIDLAPLSALAEVHGGSHQQNVGDTIAVDIEGVDLTAIVGADLEEIEEWVGWEQGPQCAGALPPSLAGLTGIF